MSLIKYVTATQFRITLLRIKKIQKLNGQIIFVTASINTMVNGIRTRGFASKFHKNLVT